MRLSALDCLARGGAILRGNARLVPWRWGLMLIPTLFGVLAVVLPLLAAGGASLDNVPEDPRQLEAWLTEIGERMVDNPQPLLLALVGSAALLLLAVVAWGFIEAGSYGVLYGADRQAPPKAPAGPWYRTLSLREFFGWGGRYLWRYVGLLLLWCVLLAILGAGVGLLAALTGVGATRWGPGAGFGIGCGGALPLAFLFFALFAGLWLAMADLVRQESGVWRGLGTGLGVFGRRFGAVLVLLGVWLVGMVAVTAIFVIPGLLLRSLTGGVPEASAATEVVLQLIQSLVSQYVHLWLAASVVVLVRSETRATPQPEPLPAPAGEPPAGAPLSGMPA
jgi:hypothetical protein